jgi:hypothetical protein
VDVNEWEFGPNSLTVTDRGFSNRQHKDNDKSDFTFGWFWSGSVREEMVHGQLQHRWAGDLSCRADMLKGGQFYWGKHGIAAGLPKEDGILMEIAWRGAHDEHGTAGCEPLGDNLGWTRANRLGCSVQITRRAVGAVERERLNNNGNIDPERYHRVEGNQYLESKQAGKRRRDD